MSTLSKRIISLAVAVVLYFGCVSTSLAATATNYGERWTNGKGTVNCSQNSGGKLAGSWSNEANSGGNTIMSVGWSDLNLSGKSIGYNCGQFTNNNGNNGCSYVMFYGWSKTPLVEYYIIENWHNYSNNSGTKKSTVTINGASYNVYVENKTNQPSIVGNSSNFTQYKSIRASQASLGQNTDIDLNAHFNAWKSAGLASSPTWSYGVMAFEGYQSKGSGNLSVWANNF